MAILEGGVVVVGLFMIIGTLLSLSDHPHWLIRGWDFPRVQIAALAALAGGTYAAFFLEGQWHEWAFVAASAACVAWQVYWIFPYTPLAPKQVQRAAQPAGDASLRLVASNVLMENEQYDRWLEVIRRADPDVILALEVNGRWLEAIKGLEADYPYRVYHPQDNCYGLALLSRLRLADPRLCFIVDEEVPSVHAEVELRSGQRICLHGVHPRPPEPLRGTDAAQRDAEVVVMAREIKEEENRRPTIIAGDFNDVAWSYTTKLFIRLSRMLDPRQGRGFYNSFDANSRLMRFPLDHVFHSNHFKLVSLELLEHVGSDHFPVLIELSYEPSFEEEQPEPAAEREDEEEAEEKIEQAEERGETVDRNPL